MKRTHIDAYMPPVPRTDGKKRRAYLIGSGMASLSAALFLIRDAGMPGDHIVILEKEHLPGGACDGYDFEGIGFLMRGEHKFDAHAACLWELLRSVPSLKKPEASVLMELHELSRRDPNYAIVRGTRGRGEDAHLSAFGLSDGSEKELLRLTFTADEAIAEKRIEEVLSGETLGSDFFLMLRSLFGFTGRHGALALKKALLRYAESLSGIADMRAFLYAGSNLYDAIVRPLTEYLSGEGVEFRFGTTVTDVAFDCAMGRKRATRIDFEQEGASGCIDLTDEDFVFITVGSCTENSTRGGQEICAPYVTEIREGGSFDLWRRISEQDVSFGHPEVFSLLPEITAQMTATVTLTDDRILPFIKKICRRDPHSGKVTTGGAVTVTDSPWLLGWSVPRQPLFDGQKPGECIVLLSGGITDVPGSYIDKPMREATGLEICEEWLWHIGVPVEEIAELAGSHARTVPVLMPFMTAPLLAQVPGDRPDIVPEGAVNFAFVGQFAETDCGSPLTVDYAVQTAIEAVYTLFGIDKPVPESSDEISVREILRAAAVLRDGKSIHSMQMKRAEKMTTKKLLRRIRGSEIEKLMKEYKLI